MMTPKVNMELELLRRRDPELFTEVLEMSRITPLSFEFCLNFVQLHRACTGLVTTLTSLVEPISKALTALAPLVTTLNDCNTALQRQQYRRYRQIVRRRLLGFQHWLHEDAYRYDAGSVAAEAEMAEWRSILDNAKCR